ncbi:MAG: hypothetical protein V4510_08265 [bacterium]
MRSLALPITAFLLTFVPIGPAHADPIATPAADDFVDAIITITELLDDAPCLAPTVPQVGDCPGQTGNTTVGWLLGVVDKWASRTPGPDEAREDVANCLDGVYCVEFWLGSNEPIQAWASPLIVSTGGGMLGKDFMVSSDGRHRLPGLAGLGAYRLLEDSGGGTHC